MMRFTRFKVPTMFALVGAAFVGCGEPETGDGATAAKAETSVTSAAAVSGSIADKVIAANTKADRELGLLARKVLNNGTEVAEFYEPVQGQIVFSAAGSPSGPSVLHRDLIQGKTASQVWAVVAPGEAVPQALADAIERSRTAAPDDAILNVAPKQPEATSATDTTAAAVKPEIVPFATGYCSGQFWTDWGNWGGSNSTVSQTYNYGYNYNSWSNVTGTAGYIVCPQGNVSGTGGQLTVNFPNGTTSVWQVLPNYYRWATSTAGENCGWDISCWASGLGDRCSPVAFGITGRYDSSCYLTKGTSCGDNYDWITFASIGSSYCEIPNFN